MGRSNAPRVLVVEDSKAIREMVIEALVEAGYVAGGRIDGGGLEDVLGSFRPDLVVLDDRVRGLDGGADDYVVKPFLLAELVSRVGAVLRRRGRLPSAIQLGDLVVDPEAGAASRAGQVLELTATELRLLTYLSEQRNRTVSKDQILTAVGLRRLRPEPGRGLHLRVAPQARSPRPPHPAHRARPGLRVADLPVTTTATTTTATPSQRRRVTLTVLGLIAALLLVVGTAVDLALGVQLRRDVHDRLITTADRATALSRTGTPPAALVDQLAGGNIRVRIITPDGASYGDPAIDPNTTAGQHPPPPRPPRPRPDATSTVVTHRLPGGARLILVADTTPITDVRRELRVVMLIAGLATLILAALLLSAAVRGALRPLDRLTALAGRITSGDRGRRLRPDRAGTELGRAASAFDGMLDALEAAEIRAQTAARDAQIAGVQARRAKAETRQFLSDAAHELRTPLAGI